MKTFLYRLSNLKSTITFLALVHSRSQFVAPVINRRILLFIQTNNNYHNHLLHTGFLRVY